MPFKEPTTTDPTPPTTKKPTFKPGKITKIVTKTLTAMEKRDRLELKICSSYNTCPEPMCDILPFLKIKVRIKTEM